MNMRGPLLVSVAFVLVTGLLGAGLVVLLRGGVSGDRTYSAIFTETSGLEVGEDVRAVGVAVGEVTGIEVLEDNTVRVSFDVVDVPLTDGTQVAVRYKNLLGDRFLALSEGPGHARALAPDAVIPVTRTKPALDLDELYNGFSPLFEGLAPDQINQLSSSIIAVLQGEGGAINALLGDVGSLTGTLADRDELIGRLIDGLNTVLTTLNTNGEQLGELVDNLQQLVSGLSSDRERIGRSLSGINDMTVSVSDLLRDARPDVAGTITQLDRLATVVNADRAAVEDDLSNVPGYYAVLGRLGSYSSAFQFYLCGVQLRLRTPTGQIVESPFVSSEVERCQF